MAIHPHEDVDIETAVLNSLDIATLLLFQTAFWSFGSLSGQGPNGSKELCKSFVS